MATQPTAVAESIAELKFGQVGIANLRLRQLDPAGLEAELTQKVLSAPQLFARAPVVLDLSHLATLPARAQVEELLARIRSAGMLPVGLSYGTSENEELARSLDLPVLAKFRAAYERSEPAVPAPAPPQPERSPAAASAPVAAAADVPVTGMHHDQPIRSGQQIYARNRDLVLTKLVGNGAEVIADGSIHIYSALRGRALAGAQGDTRARIYCQEFHAELISIAGQYRVFEDIPDDLRGKPVQAWLDGDKLLIAKLG